MELGCASGAPSAAREPARIFERFSARTIQAHKSVPRINGTRRALASLIAAVVVAAAFPNVAAAQGNTILERLNLDRLQLTSLGAWAGPIRISQVNETSVFGLSADYGEIARGIRVVFGVSYWQSRYTDKVVQAFVDTLHSSLVNPGTGTAVASSQISLYDVTFSGEFRWTKPSPAALKPYLGLGISAHVINADGPLINGTFVERSLDDIAAGLFASGGLTLRIVNHFGLEGSARVDLLSGFRSIQARGGFNYYFGHLRSVAP